MAEGRKIPVSKLDVKKLSAEMNKIWSWQDDDMSDLTESEYVPQDDSEYDTEKEKATIEAQRSAERITRENLRRKRFEREKKWDLLRAAEDRRNLLLDSRKIYTRPTQLTFEQLLKANEEGYISDSILVPMNSPEKLEQGAAKYCLSDEDDGVCEADESSSPAATPEPKKPHLVKKKRLARGKQRRALGNIQRAASSPDVSPTKVKCAPVKLDAATQTPERMDTASQTDFSMGVYTDCKTYKKNLKF